MPPKLKNCPRCWKNGHQQKMELRQDALQVATESQGIIGALPIEYQECPVCGWADEISK